jgi:4-hydroxy-4-methyl-2-oxoglutarate aldolase
VDVAALSRRYRAVGTAAVFSAVEGMGAPTRLLSLEIRPIRPDQVVAGPAFTLKAVRDPRTHHTPETEVPRLADYAMFRAMTPGCVIVADPGEPLRTGFWGDLMSAAAQTSGATGIVIDGRARDSRELVRMERFAVFCRGTTMSSTERRVNTVDFQVPLAVAGAFEHQVEVRPGDWVYGDLDGVIAIAPELVEPVLAAAEEAEAREALIRADFEAGMKAWDVYPKHRRL